MNCVVQVDHIYVVSPIAKKKKKMKHACMLALPSTVGTSCSVLRLTLRKLTSRKLGFARACVRARVCVCTEMIERIPFFAACVRARVCVCTEMIERIPFFAARIHFWKIWEGHFLTSFLFISNQNAWNTRENLTLLPEEDQFFMIQNVSLSTLITSCWESKKTYQLRKNRQKVEKICVEEILGQSLKMHLIAKSQAFDHKNRSIQILDSKTFLDDDLYQLWKTEVSHLPQT